MKNSQAAKERILSSIKKSIESQPVSIPYPEINKQEDQDVYVTDCPSLEEKFISEFNSLGGKFIYCADRTELQSNLIKLADTMNWERISIRDTQLQLTLGADLNHLVNKEYELSTADAGISYCESLIARTGSLIVSSGQEYGRQLPVYAAVHIVVAHAKQLVWDWQDGLELLKKKYNNKLPSLISLTTGPSRTADIEKTLVVGVHGPKEVYVFLVD